MPLDKFFIWTKIFFKSRALRGIIFLAFLLYLFHFVNLEEFFENIQKARLSLIVLAILTIFLDRVFMGFKWGLLLSAQGIQVSLFESTRAYFVSALAGMLLPSPLGADLIRLTSISVKPDSREKVFASIVMEKVLGLGALLALIPFCLLFLMKFEHLKHGYYFFIAVGSFLILFLLLMSSFMLIPAEKLKKAGGKFSKKIANVVLAYYEYRFYRKALVQFFILSFFEQLLPVVVNFLIGSAFHFSVGFVSYAIVIPITLLISRIPISIDGLGIQEALYMTLFPWVGLSRTNALLLGVVARILVVFSLLAGLPLYFRNRFLFKKDLK